MGFLNKSNNTERLMIENDNLGKGKDLITEETALERKGLDRRPGLAQLTIDFNKIHSVIEKEALILITNLDGEIVYVNENCRASLGYQPEELIGKHTRIFKTGVHSLQFYHDLWGTLLSGENWKGEITAKRKDGTTEWYFMSIFPLLDDNQQPYQFLTIRTDITKLKEMENLSLKYEKQFHSVIGILTDFVVGAIDQNAIILYVSSTVEDIVGYNVSESIGLSLYDYIDPETLPHFKQSLEELKKVPGSSKTIEITLRNKRGAFLPCQFTAKNHLHDPILHAIVFHYRDITEQKRFNQELKKIVYYDYLTGLSNYKCFDAVLSNEIEQAKESNTNLAIIQLGLDDFKYVNSSLGHSSGDQLLKDFSNRVKTALSDNLTMYRMNGDTFLLLMKGILDVEKLPETLNPLLSLVNKEPFMINKNEVYISVSMGVSVFPYSGENKELLLKNSEIAMYSAKKNGKNQYQIFPPTMNLQSYKQFTLRNDSKHALLRDEFRIYYQPRISSITNQIVSAEALIRWNHPKWGIVLPDEFISMAEESGLIIPIGEWIIRMVCLKLKKWKAENVPVRKISVNLSALQLLQPNFVEMVSSILKETGMDSKWIEFEITETVILEKEEEIFNKLSQLKNLGITIALDDFGTGYSSLNYLKKYPCDVIKLDKSLIEDIDKDKDNYEIISSIICLCHKLNKSVVAEGVETEEQLFILRKLLCNEMQGYFYSKPIDEQGYKKVLVEGLSKKTGEQTIFNLNKNNRKYFRLDLPVPLTADMTIKEIVSKKVSIGSSEVIVKNIGPGGLCFYSPLKLPVSKEIILQFTTEILSEQLTLIGKIVWNKEIEGNYYQYGVEFVLNDAGRENVIKLLNHFQIKLRNSSKLSGCRFYKD